MMTQGTTIKYTIGLTFSSLIVVAVLILTVRFTGHAKARGVLSIVVLFIDFMAISVLFILSITKVLTNKLYGIYTSAIILSFIAYIIFHGSYDSYNENRRVLWGLNGE